MNILVVSQYYYPERFLINDITKALVEKGHSVTVLTALPNYPTGVIPREYKDKSRRNEMIDGVRVVRCPIIPRGKNKIQIILNYISFMFSANSKIKRLKDSFDVVFLYQLTPISQAIPAISYCKKYGKKLVCYCLDIAPACGMCIAGKLSLLKKAYTAFSKWVYSKCDTIAVTSRGFIDYLNHLHEIPPERMVYLPQHASQELLHADLTKADENVRQLMFAGNLGFATKLDTIIKAADSLVKRNVVNFHITFVGDGSCKESLMQSVKELGLEAYISFRGAVPMDKMAEVYKEADALLITLIKGQTTVPAKLQSYMATGKAIFGSMDGSGQMVISEAGCGVCVNAEDVEAYADALEDYLKFPEKYAACGIKGRAFFEENFTLDIYIDKLINLLKND